MLFCSGPGGYAGYKRQSHAIQQGRGRVLGESQGLGRFGLGESSCFILRKPLCVSVGQLESGTRSERKEVYLDFKSLDHSLQREHTDWSSSVKG